MTQKQQLLAVLYVWLALTLTSFAFDLRLVAHFNNGVVLLFCAAAIWFFHNDDE